MSLCDCVMSVPNCQYKTKIINLLLVDQLLFRFHSPLKKNKKNSRTLWPKFVVLGQSVSVVESELTVTSVMGGVQYYSKTKMKNMTIFFVFFFKKNRY